MANKKRIMNEGSKNKKLVAVPFLDGVNADVLGIAVDKSDSELKSSPYAPDNHCNQINSRRLLTLEALTNAGGVPTAIIEAASYLPEDLVVKSILDHYQKEMKILQKQIEKLGEENCYLKKMLESKLFPEGNPIELNHMEECIIEALQKNTILAEELSKKAGYPNSSHFRNTLSSLRKRRILGNKPRLGYFLQPAYQYLLEQ